MTARWQEEPSDSSVRICTLLYCPPQSLIELTEGFVILLALRDAVGLSLYVHRSRMQLVSERDQEYIEDLLMDLAERAKRHPEDVFQQLANLSSGPLVTDAVERYEWHDVSVANSIAEFSLCEY